MDLRRDGRLQRFHHLYDRRDNYPGWLYESWRVAVCDSAKSLRNQTANAKTDDVRTFTFLSLSLCCGNYLHTFKSCAPTDMYNTKRIDRMFWKVQNGIVRRFRVFLSVQIWLVYDNRIFARCTSFRAKGTLYCASRLRH